jgi:hypothetical protein
LKTIAIFWSLKMDKTEEIVSALSGSDPVVLAMLVALAGIALGGMALWVLVRLNNVGDRK